MSFRSSITIVASPRPRVGKTLLARLLTDFHLHEGRLVTAFDLNTGDRRLAQVLPGKTRAASIRYGNGQMAFFDNLLAYEDITKVIDVVMKPMRRFFPWPITLDLSTKRGGGQLRWPFCTSWLPITPRSRLIAAYASVSRMRRWRPCITKCSAPPSIATNIRSLQEDRAWCAWRSSRRVCADTSRRRLIRSPIRASPIHPLFPLPHMPSLSGGYAEFIWSSASSIYAYCWPICSHPSNSARIHNRKGTEPAAMRFLGRTFPARSALAEERASHVDYTLHDRYRDCFLLRSRGEGHGIL